MTIWAAAAGALIPSLVIILFNTDITALRRQVSELERRIAILEAMVPPGDFRLARHKLDSIKRGQT